MEFTDSVESVQDAVVLGERMRKYWFRGHPEEYEDLIPRVFRPEYANRIRGVFPPPPELSFIVQFRRRAPAVARKPLPESEDRLGWLALMQHHRTPTRLLDWTENSLVALYFAVEDTSAHGEDGELWVMDPYALNKASGAGYALPIARVSRHVEFLARLPTWNNTEEKLAEELDIDRPPEGPLPVPPVQNFERIVTQQATFTIHPEPEEGNRITDLLTEPEALARYEIPAGVKEDIRQALEALGYTAGRLFPDLDGLSRELEQGERTFGEPAKEPPEFDRPRDSEVDPVSWTLSH